MAAPPRTRMPAVVAVSVGGHLLLAFFLMRVPVGQELVRKVIPIQMVRTEAPKPKPPEPKPEPPKAKVKGAVKQAAKARPAASRPAPTSASPGSGGAGFGLSADSGDGGTLAVPVGETLEAESTATASAAPPAPLVLDVSDDTPLARALDKLPAPIGILRVAYPEVARLSGQSGSAVVVAYVEADGRVASAEVVSSSNRTFAKAALEAVRGTRFKPAEREGVKVAASIRVPVRFQLAESKVDATIEADDAPLAPSDTSPDATASPATTGATP
ncbi:Gram-negative bacterial tonB protein [compost metagenome]